LQVNNRCSRRVSSGGLSLHDNRPVEEGDHFCLSAASFKGLHCHRCIPGPVDRFALPRRDQLAVWQGLIEPQREWYPMLDPKSQNDLKDAIGECIGADASVLDALRSEIRPLKSLVRRIQPRATTSISLVGTDGGNNQLQFDPFLIQMIRVVDSSDNQYCLEVVSPTTPVSRLVRRHLNEAGAPITALGEMMSVFPPSMPTRTSEEGPRRYGTLWRAH
jgi:hypothetical protein